MQSPKMVAPMAPGLIIVTGTKIVCPCGCKDFILLQAARLAVDDMGDGNGKVQMQQTAMLAECVKCRVRDEIGALMREQKKRDEQADQAAAQPSTSNP